MCSINHAVGDGLRLVRASGVFTRYEDGSEAKLELLSRMSKVKQQRPGILSSLGRAVMDFGKVLNADKQPPETSTALHEAMSIFPKANVRATVHSEVGQAQASRSPSSSCTPVAKVDFGLVKQIKSQCPTGTTVNDVILTAFTGAIRRYLEKQGDPSLTQPEGPLMRSFCAFSMPDLQGRISGSSSLYNEFVMPSIILDLNPDRQARLQAMHDVMAEVKVSFVGFFTLMMSSVLGQLGLEGFAGKTNCEIFKNHSFVYSNVPGAALIRAETRIPAYNSATPFVSQHLRAKCMPSAKK